MNKYTYDFYTYAANLASLAPGAVATVNVQVEADSDFEWMKSAFFGISTITGAATFTTAELPLITVQIQDSGSGRNLFNQPVNVLNICGDGKLPNVLPVARMFRANSNISFSFTNISSATTYSLIQFAMIGRKAWKVA